MTDPTGAIQGEGIGARLRAARERAGLSSLQAAAKLHLEPRAIEALEAGDFAVLGAPVYVRGHLRRYAELIDAPVEELLQAYSAQAADSAMPDPALMKATVPVHPPRQLAGPVVGVIVAATVMAGIWLALKGLPNAARPGTTPAAADVPPVTRAPQPAAAPDAVPAEALAVMPAAPAPAAEGVSVAEAPPADTQRLHLRLTVSVDSWVEAYDAAGKRLYYDLARAPVNLSLAGVPPLRVLLGNVAGVALEVDGRRIEVPAGVRHGRSARFHVSTGGVVSAAT
ncbi:MAG: helix-turn-helix domain-containing protein [Steroidobacteraceae bacterium]